jgi:hypothetical protein
MLTGETRQHGVILLLSTVFVEVRAMSMRALQCRAQRNTLQPCQPEISKALE